jgi:hypothetical protein
LKAIHGHFITNRIIALIDPDQDKAEDLMKKIPLLSARTKIDGRATAYVCENFACQLPVTTPEALLKQLGIEKE